MIQWYYYVLPFSQKKRKCTYRKGVEMMAYNKKNQSDYNKKCEQFKVQYRLCDIDEGKRLKAYLMESGQSANSYIKGLIKADLDNKGIAYPDSTDIDIDID